MPEPLTRTEALRLLGVPPSADAATRKRAYRRLAREHHPDRGGDPGTFHRLQQAYERLEEDGVPPAPTVARGRPSRAPAAHTSEDARTDVSAIRWDVEVAPGEVSLDRERLAVLLAGSRGAPMRRVVATSRAPGSLLNRVAARLAGTLTARMIVEPTDDDRGRTVVIAELTASGRRARRALDRAPVDGDWTRTRRSSSTSLRTSLPLADDPRISATRVTHRVADLLDGLGWPLGDWTSTVERP